MTPVGFEPTTGSLEGCCSILSELRSQDDTIKALHNNSCRAPWPLESVSNVIPSVLVGVIILSRSNSHGFTSIRTTDGSRTRTAVKPREFKSLMSTYFITVASMIASHFFI